MHSPSLAPSSPPLKFIALGVYGLFPSWCTSPPFRLIWHLPTVCIMLWVFLQLFMNIRALSHLCRGAPLPLLLLLLLLSLLPCLLSLFSPRFPPTPILADRQTNSFFWSRVVSWCCLFSQLTAWTHTHTRRHTNANMLTPVQHHKLRGEYRWHKYEPTRAVLRGMTQVSLRWTLTACKGPDSQKRTHTSTQTVFLFEYTSLLILLPDHICW